MNTVIHFRESQDPIEEEKQKGPKNPYQNNKGFFKDNKAATTSSTKTVNKVNTAKGFENTVHLPGR